MQPNGDLQMSKKPTALTARTTHDFHPGSSRAHQDQSPRAGAGFAAHGDYQRTVAAPDANGGDRALGTASDQPWHAPRSYATAPAGRAGRLWPAGTLICASPGAEGDR